jgi:hypothetical protein
MEDSLQAKERTVRAYGMREHGLVDIIERSQRDTT